MYLKNKINVLFGFSVFFIIMFLNSVHADSNGIWFRAEDVLGNESGAVFGSDFDGDNRKFSFYNGSLNIGESDYGLMDFANKWSLGFNSEKFVFGDGSDNVVSFNSSNGYSDNSVIKVDSSEYSAVDFGDGDSGLWGVGKNDEGDFYISEHGDSNRVEIDESRVKIQGDKVDFNVDEGNFSGDLNVEGGADIEGGLDVSNTATVDELVAESGVDVQDGSVDMNNNRIVNLDDPQSSSDAVNREYTDDFSRANDLDSSGNVMWENADGLDSEGDVIVGGGTEETVKQNGDWDGGGWWNLRCPDGKVMTGIQISSPHHGGYVRIICQ